MGGVVWGGEGRALNPDSIWVQPTSGGGLL